jgi:single-strand DNA-binding protein
VLTAIIAGNIGQSETKTLNDGTVVCNFSVASSRKFKGEETTTWARCAIFGKRAEALGKYLTKGTKVTVVGELSTREYDKRDGGKGFSLEIRASDVALMGGGQRNESSGDSAPRGDAYEGDSAEPNW